MTLFALLASPPQTVVVQGHRPTSSATVGTAAMRYLPFDVPRGVTSIEIVPEILDQEGDRDTVDLGLFDPHGTNARGFRGWQGGTRRLAVIAGTPEATAPWAIPGPLPAGRWNLAQYYLKASTKGLDYRYTITFRFDGPVPPARTPKVESPVDPGGVPGWYVGDLHAHSLSSDGALSLVDLLRRHRDAGYDFLASSEHNTPAAHWRIAAATRAVPGVVVIPGAELTTPGGHANLIGLRPERWIDFRTQPGDGGLPRAFAEARRQGAMVEINHPFADCTSCAWTFAPDEWRDAHGIEVWNALWDSTDEQALALWDTLLRSGRRIFAYGGSDFHRDPAPLGPAVRVWSKSKRPKDLVEALRKGRLTVMQSPKGPILEIEADRALLGGTSHTSEIRVTVRNAPKSLLTVHTRRGVEGEPLPVEGSGSWTIPLKGKGLGFVRLELRRPDGAMLALTNPIFLR